MVPEDDTGRVTKPDHVRIYLNAENKETLQELAKRWKDFSESQLATLFLAACLRAAKESDYRITLPLNVKFIDEPSVTPRAIALNEPKPTRGK
jgi:hypothetical protein